MRDQELERIATFAAREQEEKKKEEEEEIERNREIVRKRIELTERVNRENERKRNDSSSKHFYCSEINEDIPSQSLPPIDTFFRFCIVQLLRAANSNSIIIQIEIFFNTYVGSSWYIRNEWH